MTSKRLGKRILCYLLEAQVRRLRRKHRIQVVAVAGSIGKTSTKLAVAHTLEASRRVIYQTGNYNDRLTVPLVLFGRTMPGLFNVPAWTKILLANEQTIRLGKYYDIAVLELGTDGPGQIQEFVYLNPDVTIVTAITPEHMEYFKTLDAVAAEELEVCNFSRQVLVNADDTPGNYLEGRQVLKYGLQEAADYRAVHRAAHGLQGTDVSLHLKGEKPFMARSAILGEQGEKVLLAAAAAAHLLGLSIEEIQKGLKEVRPFSGRMQILQGIKNSTIIDDTYNASPAPVIAALDVLYGADAPQKIAILGSMNELGSYSVGAHREVGNYCRADQLDVVVAIGAEAERYLAPAAQKRGCKVACFASPYEAGDYIAGRLQEGSLVLAEGSERGVFAEESLKALLQNPGDQNKLVRQTAYWMRIKADSFQK